MEMILSIALVLFSIFMVNLILRVSLNEDIDQIRKGQEKDATDHYLYQNSPFSQSYSLKVRSH